MELVCYLSNFLALGIEITENENGGWIRNKIPLTVAGLNIVIIQNPKFININRTELRGQFVKSTKLIVKNVDETNLEPVLTIVENISNLLSFATSSEVFFYSWSIDETRKSFQRSGIARYCSFGAPFCCDDTSSIKMLIESCYDSYSQIHQPRALNVVINMLNAPEANYLQLELKLATMFILLENLKSTYAQTKGYRFKGSYKTVDNNSYSFESLLLEMFSVVKMDVNLKKIKSLRNEIIHSGLSKISNTEMSDIYADCRDIVTEYFLRLIGFKGDFSPCASRGLHSKTIT